MPSLSFMIMFLPSTGTNGSPLGGSLMGRVVLKSFSVVGLVGRMVVTALTGSRRLVPVTGLVGEIIEDGVCEISGAVDVEGVDVAAGRS